ncbi:hypothetical protein ACT2CC_00860 [Candidatus Vidania fulgoroideorum]
MNFYSFLSTKLSEYKIDKSLSEFKIKYIYKGIGEAIGNLIRKTLFCCIEGSAIEKICFKSLNEFSYIPGIDKDLTDILLSIKNIYLKLKVKRIKLKYNIKGPKTFYSKSLSNKYCKVINKKKIFRYEDTKKLKFYFIIGKGIGYKCINKNYNNKNEILVDSYYCPIEKSYFRIEKKKEYDNLIIGVKTNLTLSPREAFNKSIKIIKKSFSFKKKKIKKNDFKKIKKKLFNKKELNFFFKKKVFFYGDITKKILRNLSNAKKKKIMKILKNNETQQAKKNK